MGSKAKIEWFDLNKSAKLKESLQQHVRGELKLIGRPLKILASTADEAIDLGRIEIGILHCSSAHLVYLSVCIFVHLYTVHDIDDIID